LLADVEIKIGISLSWRLRSGCLSRQILATLFSDIVTPSSDNAVATIELADADPVAALRSSLKPRSMVFLDRPRRHDQRNYQDAYPD
jgi:hypothetical protein